MAGVCVCVYMCVCVCAQSHLTLCDPTDCSPCPLSMGFSRQEYGSGVPFPSPGNLPDSGMEPESPALQADSFLSKPIGEPNKRSQEITSTPLFQDFCPRTPLDWEWGW